MSISVILLFLPFAALPPPTNWHNYFAVLQSWIPYDRVAVHLPPSHRFVLVSHLLSDSIRRFLPFFYSIIMYTDCAVNDRNSFVLARFEQIEPMCHWTHWTTELLHYMQIRGHTYHTCEQIIQKNRRKHTFLTGTKERTMHTWCSHCAPSMRFEPYFSRLMFSIRALNFPTK